MPTGYKKLIAKTKRLFGVNDLNERVVGYLNEKIKQVVTRFFPGSFSFGIIELDATQANSYLLKLTTDNPAGKMVDGDGNMLTVSESSYAEEQNPFPNAMSETYYVGLKGCSIPSGIRTNPRTGRQEYIGMEDEIGIEGVPSQIIDNGNETFTFEIDNHLFNAADDWTGKTALVWLNDIAIDASTYDETVLSVVLDSSNSFTISSKLGQTILSLNESDYTITIMGTCASTYRNEMLNRGCTLIGKVTGNGIGATPTQFDYLSQLSLDMDEFLLSQIRSGPVNIAPSGDADMLELGVDGEHFYQFRLVGVQNGVIKEVAEVYITWFGEAAVVVTHQSILASGYVSTISMTVDAENRGIVNLHNNIPGPGNSDFEMRLVRKFKLL